MEPQLVRREAVRLEINDWFDFFLYGCFTVAVAFVLVPFGVSMIYLGTRCFQRFGFGKLPAGVLPAGLGNSARDLFIAGVLSLLLAWWYLFIDQGGHFLGFVLEARSFLFAD
jgi:hypothetical protein